MFQSVRDRHENLTCMRIVPWTLRSGCNHSVIRNVRSLSIQLLVVANITSKSLIKVRIEHAVYLLTNIMVADFFSFLVVFNLKFYGCNGLLLFGLCSIFLSQQICRKDLYVLFSLTTNRSSKSTYDLPNGAKFNSSSQQLSIVTTVMLLVSAAFGFQV
jgi:hypothetical protein